MNLIKAIEVAMALRNETDKVAKGYIAFNDAGQVIKDKWTMDADALTTLITLAQGVDAAKLDDAKVWRGNWGDNPVFTDTDDIDGNAEVVLRDAASHDALVARCAKLEQRVAELETDVDAICTNWKDVYGWLEARRALARGGGHMDDAMFCGSFRDTPTAFVGRMEGKERY